MLRTKWTLTVLAVALLPMIVIGVIVLEIQRRGLARAEKELEVAVVDEAATALVSSLDRAELLAARTKGALADPTLEVDSQMRVVADLVAMTPAITGIAFFDESRQFVDAIVRTHDETLRLPPEAEGFRALEPGTFRFETTIPGRGFLVVGIAPLAPRLGDLSVQRFGAPDRVSVVGEPKGAPIVEAAGVKSFDAALVLTTEFGDRVGTIRTLPAQHAALVVERPKAEAFAALSTSRQALSIALGVVAALSIFVAIFAARRVLRPIASLMRLVDRYARREFAARAGLRTGDELEALGTSLERMADDLAASEAEIASRARIEANLRRYLPEEAARAAQGKLDLGGSKKNVTVVFADVVAFTSFAERTSPEHAVALLNELFTMLSEIVFRHEGMVDKFIGDCIMAVFADAERALAATEDMHAFVASNMPRWREAYAFDVKLGIGVATGDALVGNLGSESRMEYTAIGDTVNVAARLESLARPGQTLATRAVTLACRTQTFHSLGEHALRGKAAPIEVFEVAS